MVGHLPGYMYFTQDCASRSRPPFPHTHTAAGPAFATGSRQRRNYAALIRRRCVYVSVATHQPPRYSARHLCRRRREITTYWFPIAHFLRNWVGFPIALKRKQAQIGANLGRYVQIRRCFLKRAAATPQEARKDRNDPRSASCASPCVVAIE